MIPAVMSRFFPSSGDQSGDINEIRGELPDKNKCVTLLGKEYEELEDIQGDFQSRLWFTYRRNFASIGGSGPTSDQGWGCMLRAGQMLVAECLLRQRLGRNYVWSESSIEDERYTEILELFRDTHSAELSLQQIALTGATAEKRAVGEWFGPNTMAQVLKRITKSRSLGFGVTVAMDSVVSVEDVSAEIINGGKPTPLVLMIPLRLGLNSVNEIYVNPLKIFLASKYCVGIMGGKPNQAHYFVGYQETVEDTWLLYLDPHTTQQSPVSVNNNMPFEQFDKSLHTDKLCWIKALKLDPSLAVGFFFNTVEEFILWTKEVRDVPDLPFGVVDKVSQRKVAVSSVTVTADSDDSTSDYEVLDIY